MSQSSALVRPELLPRDDSFVPPYRRSWVDRLTTWLAAPASNRWLIYLLLALVLFVSETLVQWREGSYPIGTFNAFQFVLSVMAPFALWTVGYLNRVALHALRTFRPATRLSDAEFDELAYRLTALPPPLSLAIPFLAAVGVAVQVGITLFRPQVVQDVMAKVQVAITPLSLAVSVLLGGAWSVLFSVLLVKIYHQLVQVYRISTRDAVYDLFHLGPLYAFSGLTARMSLVTIGVTTAFFAAAPVFIFDPIGIFNILISTAVAAVTFALPLVGIHNHLVAEKQRMLSETSGEIKAALAELHDRLHRGDMAEMDPMNKALSSLELELRVIRAIPTWPWQPETLRWIITALMFPIIVFVAQFVLQRLLH